MYEVIRNIANIVWLVLGIYGLVSVRRWDKRFAELYERTKAEVDSWEDQDDGT